MAASFPAFSFNELFYMFHVCVKDSPKRVLSCPKRFLIIILMYYFYLALVGIPKILNIQNAAIHASRNTA